MSKFDDLCKTYGEARKDYFSYRDECFNFIVNLIGRFINYLEIPKEQIKYLPMDKNPEKNKTYSLFGATHLNDDTYWYTGVEITLYEAPNIFPHQPVLMCFRVKKSGNGFIVKMDPNDCGYTINPDSEEDFIKLFSYITAKINNLFTEGLQEFLEKSARVKTIGFLRK